MKYIHLVALLIGIINAGMTMEKIDGPHTTQTNQFNTIDELALHVIRYLTPEFQSSSGIQEMYGHAYAIKANHNEAWKETLTNIVKVLESDSALNFSPTDRELRAKTHITGCFKDYIRLIELNDQHKRISLFMPLNYTEGTKEWLDPLSYIFESIQSLILKEVPRDIIAQRLRGYVKGNGQGLPFLQSFQEEIIRLIDTYKENSLYPSDKQLANITDLETVNSFKKQMAEWLPDEPELCFAFNQQMDGHIAFINKVLLQKAPKSSVLPQEIYELLLKIHGVNAPLNQLIDEGKRYFEQTYKHFVDLANKIASTKSDSGRYPQNNPGLVFKNLMADTSLSYEKRVGICKIVIADLAEKFSEISNHDKKNSILTILSDADKILDLTDLRKNSNSDVLKGFMDNLGIELTTSLNGKSINFEYNPYKTYKGHYERIIVGLYKNVQRDIEKILLQNDFITIPHRQLRMRLGTASEEAYFPIPHVNTPNFINNTGKTEHSWPEYVLCDALENSSYVGAYALCAHEGRPGHDLQFSRMVEESLLGNMNLFETVLSTNSTNAEGWAHYTEYAMTPYFTEECQLGALNDQLLRQARVFLDPQVNLGLITHEDIVAFYQEKLGLGKTAATSEANRYTFLFPGQAVTYRFGALQIMKLRDELMVKLGDKLSMREFHDQILSFGLLPLELIKDQIVQNMMK